VVVVTAGRFNSAALVAASAELVGIRLHGSPERRGRDRFAAAEGRSQGFPTLLEGVVRALRQPPPDLRCPGTRAVQLEAALPDSHGLVAELEGVQREPQVE
jgi:hypothetical protein